MGFTLLSLGAMVGAQERLWVHEATTSSRLAFWNEAAALGDIDGDGFSDLAVRGYDEAQSVQMLWFLSGRDGTVIRMRRLAVSCEGFLDFTGVGDLNGDGCADYAVAVWQGCNRQTPCWVELRSGADDRLFRRMPAPDPNRCYSYGWRIVGDLELDGVAGPDLLIAAPEEPAPISGGRGGAIYAYANDGRLLYKRQIARANWGIGYDLAKIGDVDGDGRDDYVTGAGNQGSRGAALLLSGADGAEIHRVFGQQLGDWIGGEVAGCADLDGDGLRDFVVGSLNLMSLGTAQAFSSATGRRLYTWRGGDPAPGGGYNAFGSEIHGDMDLDQDGIDDILIGAHAEIVTRWPRTLSGAVHAYSGRDGTRMFSVSERSDFFSDATLFGIGIARLGVQPDNPFPTFAVVSRRGAPNGRVHGFRSAPAVVGATGAPCAGSLSTAPRIGLRDLGQSGVRIHLSDAPTDAPAVLLLGLSATNIPLDAIGLPGCLLLSSAEIQLARSTGRTGLDAGYTGFDIPFPLAKGATGLTLFGQWLVLGPGPNLNGGTSAALSWRH